jgi:6-phosphogluconate dehydrogenase
MQLGMIGLGRMGGNMVLRLLRAGHDCVAYDRDAERTANFDAAEPKKSAKATALADLVKKLAPPRAVWVMLPAGAITDGAITELSGLLSAGDIIIDGGNSHFKDDVRRAQALATKKIGYLDVGTSGGVWGLERGYCLMIGGDKWAFDQVEPLLATLAPLPPKGPLPKGAEAAKNGYLYCGKPGSGHFVKMIHNGIEYGMMQAFAVGFEILQKANLPQLPEGQRYDLDLHGIAELWRHGSVISSWLLDLLEQALNSDPKLDGFSGVVQDSGEGQWTIEAAFAECVPANVLTASLFARYRSRLNPAFADKVLSALRKGFGGHQEPGKK